MPLKRILILAALVFQAGIAPAETITVNVIASQFGHLDQHLTNCPNNSCGPTAAVNSFVYLQNTYPMLYLHNLAGLSEVTEIETANSLVTSMGTCVTDKSGKKTCLDTTWENFYLGKAAYIDSHAPGTSNYSAESSFAWDPAKAGGAAKPPGVSDNTTPTVDYLIQQLQQKRDVEILAGPAGKPGHYVTLTGITWDPSTMKGQLSFVDPSDGSDRTRNISINNGFVSWVRPSDNTVVGIKTAVSEGPASDAKTPEPATEFMLGAGLILFVCCQRRLSWGNRL